MYCKTPDHLRYGIERRTGINFRGLPKRKSYINYSRNKTKYTASF